MLRRQRPRIVTRCLPGTSEEAARSVCPDCGASRRLVRSVDLYLCDPFWHNESEVAESRTEIWASEVGIG